METYERMETNKKPPVGRPLLGPAKIQNLRDVDKREGGGSADVDIYFFYF